jgi:disulfide bond formation protein DsbB
VFRLFGIFSIPQMALIAFGGLFSLCLFMAFRKTEA